MIKKRASPTVCENRRVIQIPAVFKPLLHLKKRIKLFYGGRAGGKSYAFADCLLIKARMQKLFIVCLREIQNSIKDSVHKLLCDRIQAHRLSDYRVSNLKIENLITGSTFIFKGLRDQDGDKIKSLEGADIAWIEEAQRISAKSWEILEPTIRKKDSEIWISMNRETPTDPIWVALADQDESYVFKQKVNYTDNPFCPKEMIELALRCKEKNAADYAHIWLGEPKAGGDEKLIPAVYVREAQERGKSATGGESLPNESSETPLIIGLDIARFGDDATVFCFRAGQKCTFEVYRKKSTVETAHLAVHYLQTLHPTRLFLDIGGMGAGVYDLLIEQGFVAVVRGINFGEKARLSDRYANKRAEMWDSVRLFLTESNTAVLPPDSALYDDLCAVNKSYDRNGRLLLEDKASLKRRLGRSTDWGDALALTFAAPISESGSEREKQSISLEELFQNHSSKGKW